MWICLRNQNITCVVQKYSIIMNKYEQFSSLQSIDVVMVFASLPHD